MLAFLENPWVIGISTPIIAALVIYFLGIESKKKESDKSSIKSNLTNNNHTNQTQNLIVKNYFGQKSDELRASNLHEVSSSQVNLLKQETKVLFIDDLDLKKKIKNLKEAGWVRVSQLKDAPNIDVQEIRDADVIFVDYKGIGETGSGEQGLSILSALKRRYTNEKYLILYSAHDVPVDAFNRGANSYLSKNSTIYELEQKILEGINEIKR